MDTPSPRNSPRKNQILSPNDLSGEIIETYRTMDNLSDLEEFDDDVLEEDKVLRSDGTGTLELPTNADDSDSRSYADEIDVTEEFSDNERLEDITEEPRSDGTSEEESKVGLEDQEELIVPELGSIVPALGSIVLELGSTLPELGSVVPKLGAIVPEESISLDTPEVPNFNLVEEPNTDSTVHKPDSIELSKSYSTVHKLDSIELHKSDPMELSNSEPIKLSKSIQVLAENSDADSDSDSDFGSFDDASFTEQQSPVLSTVPTFTEKTFLDKTQLDESVDKIIDLIFTVDDQPEQTKNGHILSERSNEIYLGLSTLPHLKPPNWTRLKIRHRLLIQLGIPVNLDEWEKKQPASAIPLPKIAFEKTNNSNLDKYTPEEIAQLMATTADVLSRMETENLNNSARQHLQDLTDEAQIDAKLEQFEENFKMLETLSGVWNHHLDGLKTDFEMYESIVQNFIGYSQKLKREEMMENLKTAKKIKKKPVW